VLSPFSPRSATNVSHSSFNPEAVSWLTALTVTKETQTTIYNNFTLLLYFIPHRFHKILKVPPFIRIVICDLFARLKNRIV
jgi:hypothetical protein